MIAHHQKLERTRSAHATIGSFGLDPRDAVCFDALVSQDPRISACYPKRRLVEQRRQPLLPHGDVPPGPGRCAAEPRPQRWRCRGIAGVAAAVLLHRRGDGHARHRRVAAGAASEKPRQLLPHESTSCCQRGVQWLFVSVRCVHGTACLPCTSVSMVACSWIAGLCRRNSTKRHSRAGSAWMIPCCLARCDPAKLEASPNTESSAASQLEVRFLRSQHRSGSSLCFATEVTRSRLAPGGWRPISMVARQQILNRDDCRWGRVWAAMVTPREPWSIEIARTKPGSSRAIASSAAWRAPALWGSAQVPAQWPRSCS